MRKRINQKRMNRVKLYIIFFQKRKLSPYNYKKCKIKTKKKTCDVCYPILITTLLIYYYPIINSIINDINSVGYNK